jgi:thioredoxin reductase
MPKDERYDVVIVGAGPNGMGTAAYLAKSRLSVRATSVSGQFRDTAALGAETSAPKGLTRSS